MCGTQLKRKWILQQTRIYHTSVCGVSSGIIAKRVLAFWSALNPAGFCSLWSLRFCPLICVRSFQELLPQYKNMQPNELKTHNCSIGTIHKSVQCQSQAQMIRAVSGRTSGVKNVISFLEIKWIAAVKKKFIKQETGSNCVSVVIVLCLEHSIKQILVCVWYLVTVN